MNDIHYRTEFTVSKDKTIPFRFKDRVMMQHHLSCWPLVVSIASGEPDLQELRDYSSAWTSWLDRGEPFVMLKIFLDVHTLKVRALQQCLHIPTRQDPH